MIQLKTATLKQVIFTITIVLLTIILWNYLNPSNSVQAKSSVLARVEKSKTLRCGYNIEPPSLNVDPNTGKPFGIAVDIVERMAKFLGWKVEWAEQVGWSEMGAGLQANRYDLVCVGKWIFASETRGSAFTMPIYYSAVHAYGRVDEARFDNKLSNLNSPDYRIATMDGEFNYYVTTDKFPKAKRVELPALTDFGTQILNVTTHKADVVFLAAAEADDYIRKNPGTIKRLTKDPVVVFDTAFMFKNGEPDLAEVLNSTLRQLHNDGFIRASMDKWQAAPDGYLRLAKPYAEPDHHSAD